MALIHMDGMDLYSSSNDLTAVYGVSGATISSVDGRFGGGAIITNFNDGVEFPIPSPVGTGNKLWVAVAHYYSTNPSSGGNILSFRSDLGDSTVYLFFENDPLQVQLRDVTDTVLLSFSLVKDAWNWIELEAVYGSSTGAIILRVNGAELYNGTGDTDDLGASGFSSVQFKSPFSVNARWDDILIGDDSGTTNTAPPGDTKIVTLSPNAAGSSSAFTASGAASNHEAVDEVPDDDDTTYNSSATSGDRDLFNIADLAESPDSIVAVQTRSVVRKDGAGAFTIRNVLLSGATTAVGDSFGLSTTYNHAIRDIFDTDPDTSSPWTESGVNAIEAGYEIP